MRFLLAAIAAIGALGCGSRDAHEARALAQLDPAEASLRIRAMAGDCDGLARALDRLAASGLSGRPLAALVDDAIEAARPRCPRPTVDGTAAAHRLARARLADDRPAEALVAVATGDEPVIRLRRAELLDRLGQARDALNELDALGADLDEPARTLRRALEVSQAVRTGRVADVARAIAAAPLLERPALAYRAISDPSPASLDALAAAAIDPELAAAAGDRLERERGAAAALAARERAAAAAPDRAEHQDALARALYASGRIDDALAAWDRAAARAPAQPVYRLAPIRALVALGDRSRARSRATALAAEAREPGGVGSGHATGAGSSESRVATVAATVERLLVASSAAAAIGDRAQAVELAREAQRRRPGDGRLAFEVAGRLAEAGDHEAAASAFGELLACGAHGRPWHRHEVAAKLVALAIDLPSSKLVVAALDAKRPCTVELADLATYVDAARKKLAALTPK